MHVAYDLRYAADHFTGIGTHAFCLLEALLALPGEVRYTALWDPRLPRRRYSIDALAAHPRVTLVERRIGPLHPLSPLRTGAWLRRERPDVYLSPFYFLPEGASCPCVLTIHDVWPLRMNEGLSPLRHALYRLALSRARRARLVLTSSDFSHGEIVSAARVPASRVRTVRLGVPAPRAAPRPRRPDAAPSGPFALVVGDNRPRKNLASLARAWARFGPAPPLELVAAGPVSARWPSLPEGARVEGARGVRGLGWVGEAELEWLYGHATVVLFPSLYEGFGFPLAEAFARGIPAIAADIPTLREIGEGAAEFVPAEDPGAWAATVAALAAEPARRDALRDAGRVRARALDYRTTAANTLALLREAVGWGPARTAEGALDGVPPRR